jgi:hypothetical protein
MTQALYAHRNNKIKKKKNASSNVAEDGKVIPKCYFEPRLRRAASECHFWAT